MDQVKGKVALVTGGADGSGAGTARPLAAEGASVVVADINGEAAEPSRLDPSASVGRSCERPLGSSFGTLKLHNLSFLGPGRVDNLLRDHT